MKIKGIITILFLTQIFTFRIFAQDSIVWKQVFQLPLLKEITWAVDPYDNIYLTEKDVVKKIDPKGKMLFEQSLKKYGQIAKIDARNPMKVLLFSEQQQSIFYLDNTLTKQENDIDLSDFELSYVTDVSASNQMDKIWTFDQDNSKITLITLNKAQSIKIENTAGIIDLKNLKQLYEQDDNLFVFALGKGVFQFDIYGTLIRFLPEEEVVWTEENQNYLYLLKGDMLEVLNLTTLKKNTIKLPIKSVKRFKINQKSVFLETDTDLFKFQIEIF